jgi:hypothetical protein
MISCRSRFNWTSCSVKFALLRSLTQSAAQTRPKPKPGSDPAAAGAMTDNGTEIIAPKFPIAAPVTDNGTEIIAPKFPAAGRRSRSVRLPGTVGGAAAGTLESTLSALTEHIANEQKKTGRARMPRPAQGSVVYQSAVKNVAIQFIRNAVMHGVEARRARGRRANPRPRCCCSNSVRCPTAPSNCAFKTTAAASIRRSRGASRSRSA